MRVELYLARTVASALMSQAERETKKTSEEHITMCTVPVHLHNMHGSQSDGLQQANAN